MRGKNIITSISMTPEQLEFLKATAKDLGMTVSGYIKMIVIQKMEGITK